jgi:hypothetical protein
MRFAALSAAIALADRSLRPSLPSRMKAIKLTAADREGYTREVYSVEDVRVTFDSARGWQCKCKAYAQGFQCIHIEQAQTFRQLRGAKRDDHAAELQLSAEELQALYIAAAVEQTDFRSSEAVPTSRRLLRHSRWAAALLLGAGIAGMSSAITYLATERAHAIRVAENSSPEPLAIATTQAPPPTPVKFVNPFDSTEIFEFPPGMSEADMREAVAQLLLNRARQRFAASVEMQQRNGKAVHREKPVPALRLVNRS